MKCYWIYQEKCQYESTTKITTAKWLWMASLKHLGSGTCFDDLKIRKVNNSFKVHMKWNFCPLFYSRKLKSMLHWFIIFEFKLFSGAQNNFSIPPKLAKNAIFVFRRLELVTSYGAFDCFTLSQCIYYKVTTHWAVFSAVLFCGKCPQMMDYPVTHHLLHLVMLSRCS